MRIGLNGPTKFVLRLRIPAWSERNALTINGAPQPAPTPGTYASIDRLWSDGDVVQLRLDLRARAIRAPGHPEFAAVVRGPLVLARDARLEHGSDLGAPVALESNGDGCIDVRLVGSPTGKGIWQTFELPMGNGAAPLRLCDFASAGDTWDATSAYRIWMPLAGAKPPVKQGH
jgi:hypothetical protein